MLDRLLNPIDELKAALIRLLGRITQGDSQTLLFLLGFVVAIVLLTRVMQVKKGP
jgi:hypothetical protein